MRLAYALACSLALCAHAYAHGVGCDGNPVPASVKLECCGKADEHRVEPDQITRGANGEYVVTVRRYTFVVDEDKALPSADGCAHIFFQDHSGYEGAHDVDVQPTAYCFLIPMAF